LIELILVMLIVAIMVAVAAPSLRWFLVGRRTVDLEMQILALANRARTQAISQARTCYLNFDSSKIYLTIDQPGEKGTPLLDLNGPLSVSIPASVNVHFQNTDAPQPVVLLPWPADFQAQAHPLPNQLLDGTSVGMGSIWVFPSSTAYLRFQPTGRTDPARILLTDNSGREVRLVCDGPADRLHDQEVAR
jgi:type II secretory pathway pseudopilin PulG